ncbi:MAG: ribosome-binding factor A [Halanaerobium sp. 4-GBenrich]|jgi:ribosome-binding factor A|uniref:Ribosome-binding factor A n=1 Tax=Halanaerobium congolense TaxID=54121 RepID=A0A1G6I7K2_9FIRM|nr:30S ribosome-binding factor RbfA [Halanaerobium congolense]KXS50299.1 MAG: ribosome-binding factor A [Halanaerobium sp. T82-1]ODS50923.1 MAG: ribosome-binding factor A [Halanaerobium sp. 4-GBenrich]OEG62382.1 MAG: ribosome-binding factor A [Halanaerobium sp. MDAL1]PUU92592.1 MAG: ribosome-binding factor A [Halanaerobium sp.]PTX17112.1 ribosome-binding factor A [Halanaerobium congolense]
MSNKRAIRVGELLKEEISQIVLREMKDPRIGFVSVTDVEVSGDLRHAKVFISVYGTDKEKEETMEGLQQAQGFVRKLVGERVKIHHTPEIIFRYDDSIENGVHISEIIKDLKESGEIKESDSDAEKN